ncbi:Aldolase-type TIM barrel family protein [Prunus dulcis]|uniref:Aldolase-type TIM barrel family protein n=1 Tax=Prunus dulcis TaxID=3755 RepID=A0A5H2XLK2_PRUDU|nr:Aldolase-type TIM barrel family protein [Prunus dulcis]
MDNDQVFTFAKKIAAPYDMVMQTKQLRRPSVVHFTAGRVATHECSADDAARLRQGVCRVWHVQER